MNHSISTLTTGHLHGRKVSSGFLNLLRWPVYLINSVINQIFMFDSTTHAAPFINTEGFVLWLYKSVKSQKTTAHFLISIENCTQIVHLTKQFRMGVIDSNFSKCFYLNSVKNGNIRDKKSFTHGKVLKYLNV